MRFRLLQILIIFVFSVNAQNDTLLYNNFSIQVIEIVDSSAYFMLDATNKVNIDSLGWKTRSDMKAISNDIISNVESSNIWFDQMIWRNWHMTEYPDYIKNVTQDELVQYDTLSNFGIRSFSWFEKQGRATSVLISPPVFLNDYNGALSWKSRPVQGPRHQDGYKVYILEGANNDPDNVPFETMEYAFAMKELDVSNSSPLSTITSLAELERNFGFIPEDGFDHIKYILPDTNELGEMDSTRQEPIMQQFNLSLYEYNGYIQVAFVHDSYDNNGIILDDILITGKGEVLINKIYKSNLNIFPNPAVKELFIDFDQNWKNPLVKIFDLNGRLVLRQKLDFMSSIKIGFLESGQYLLRLETNTGVYTQNFVKSI